MNIARRITGFAFVAVVGFGCASEQVSVQGVGVMRGSEESRPTYPTALRGSGVAGIVKVHAVVEPSGQVKEVRIIESPHPLLSEEVTAKLMKWRYDAQPRDWIAEYVFEFRP